MTLAAPDPTAKSAYRAGAFALVIAAATILAALAFQYLGGYVPCPLCLEQRYAYYAGVPLLFVALVLLSAERPKAAAFVFTLGALGFLANAGLGIYHSGVEWHFWPGPETCGSVQDLTTSAGGLLDALPKTNVVRCDEAAWRFAGLSFAGWNVIVSLLLFAVSIRAASASASVR